MGTIPLTAEEYNRGFKVGDIVQCIFFSPLIAIGEIIEINYDMEEGRSINLRFIFTEENDDWELIPGDTHEEYPFQLKLLKK